MENRYKVVFNKSIEYHVNADNDHRAIDKALQLLRDNGYIFSLATITIEYISNASY